MQGHILDDFLLLVHVPLGQRDVLFSFKVELGGVGITPALPLQRERSLSAWRAPLPSPQAAQGEIKVSGPTAA